jgi:hypothetical protein
MAVVRSGGNSIAGASHELRRRSGRWGLVWQPPAGGASASFPATRSDGASTCSLGFLPIDGIRQ